MSPTLPAKMYRGAGYNTQQGVINIEVDRGAPPHRAMTEEECASHVVGLCLANMYNPRKGTELFGKRADEAVVNELTRIDEFETYEPVHKRNLSAEDCDRALESMMKVTEKRADEQGNRRVKGRFVADGSKQKSYEGYEKSDGSSPTARTDSVIMTRVIDAHERRHVAMADVENAFLQSDNDQRIIMAIRGKTAELLVRMNPSLYRSYRWYSKKGVPMLYVLINKTLYGMLRVALLFYRKLRNDLEEMEFVVNPYDPCVANPDVNGSQCTIVWHMDNLKVSHKDEAVVTYLLQELGRRNKNRLKIKRGKVFDYLGRDIDFESDPGMLIIFMIKYLSQIIEEWPEELKGCAPNPHQDHLFDIRHDDGPKKELLGEEMASLFHRTTAQLLFMCMRAPPDVQTALSFFTTRVKAPDVDDWKKLRHCMLYLKGTLHMK